MIGDEVRIPFPLEHLPSRNQVSTYAASAFEQMQKVTHLGMHLPVVLLPCRPLAFAGVTTLCLRGEVGPLDAVTAIENWHRSERKSRGRVVLARSETDSARCGPFLQQLDPLSELDLLLSEINGFVSAPTDSSSL